VKNTDINVPETGVGNVRMYRIIVITINVN